MSVNLRSVALALRGRAGVRVMTRLLGAGALLIGRAVSAQQLGHKLLGVVGIDAGTQSEPGLYIIDQLVYYDANRVRARDGALLPLRGLDIDAYGNSLGLSFTLRRPGKHYLTFATSVPVARIELNSDDPLVSIDRFGLGDLFVQPIKLGWRPGHFDIVAAYAFYAPTGKFEPRSGVGVGRGFWTHQFSLGGADYLAPDRSRRVSALVSYDLNLRKRGVDLRRGNTLQIQGGAGTRVLRTARVGVAGYALWQVTNDTGTDLPPRLRNERSRVFALGPEVDVSIPAIRLRANLRFEWELGVRSRPQGQMLVGTLVYRAWQPVND